MQNSQDNLSNIPKPSAKFPVKSVVLVAVVIIIFATVYFLSKEKEGSSAIPSVEISQKIEQEVVKPNYDLMIADYFRGTVKEISGNRLQVETDEQEANPYLKNRSFEVLIEEESNIFQVQGSIFIIKNKESTEIKTDVNNLIGLSVGDLSIGDAVLIFSFDDLKEKSNFTAKEIYKISF